MLAVVVCSAAVSVISVSLTTFNYEKEKGQGSQESASVENQVTLPRDPLETQRFSRPNNPTTDPERRKTTP